jgi:hypothetical protein
MDREIYGLYLQRNDIQDEYLQSSPSPHSPISGIFLGYYFWREAYPHVPKSGRQP